MNIKRKRKMLSTNLMAKSRKKLQSDYNNTLQKTIKPIYTVNNSPLNSLRAINYFTDFPSGLRSNKLLDFFKLFLLTCQRDNFSNRFCKYNSFTHFQINKPLLIYYRRLQINAF